jgi:CelD/BcsL family acetyltransferase involved in cellulose biosynthesis
MQFLTSTAEVMNITNDDNWTVVDNDAALRNLASEWGQLFNSNPRHSPFQSWGWVDSWLKHLAGPHELRFICARNDSGRLLFILPLVRRPSRRPGCRAEYFLACGYGPDCSDYIGCLWHPVIGKSIAGMTALALSRFVEGNAHVNLTSLMGIRNFPYQLSDMLKQTGRAALVEQYQSCPAVQLPGCWDEFQNGLSRNFRSQVGRRYRKILRLEDANFHSVAPEKAAYFADEIIRLNRLRMSAKGTRSTLEDAKFRAFIREVIPRVAENGLAWMDVITNGKDAVGAAMNLVHGDRVYYYMGGFDEKYSDLHPGTVLFADVIKRSIATGYLSYDFLRGQEAYKFRWGATNNHTWRMKLYPNSLLGGRISYRKDRLVTRMRAGSQWIRGNTKAP